jgi:hypothetical protein
VRGRRHFAANLGEIRRAADRFVEVGLLEPFDQEHQIDALAAVVHGKQLLEDAAVGVVVKIAGADHQRDFVKDFRQQQDAAEDGALGFDGLRQLTLEGIDGLRLE